MTSPPRPLQPTKGPWRAKKSVTQMCDDGTTVAHVHGDWWIFSDADDFGDAESDAQLFADAGTVFAECQQTPSQLLSALRRAEAELEGAIAARDGFSAKVAQVVPERDALRARVAELEALAKPYEVLGLCDKHAHIGHFPTLHATVSMRPIKTVCPWCEPHAPALGTAAGAGTAASAGKEGER